MQALEKLTDRLPSIDIDTLRAQWARLESLGKEILLIKGRFNVGFKQNQDCKAIAEIPGVGLLTTTTTIATMGKANPSNSVESLLRATYLRTSLIDAARALLFHCKAPLGWIGQLNQRKPSNVVAVALANKMAHTSWVGLAHESPYSKEYMSVQP